MNTLEELRTLVDAVERENLQLSSLEYGKLVRACSNMRALPEGRRIHARISKDKRTIKLDAFLAADLMKMYAKCGSLEEAWDGFNTLEAKDAVVWTSMISANAQNGHFDKAVALFKRMLLEGIHPDEISLTATLTACKTSYYLSEGQLIHSIAKECGFTSSSYIGAAFVTMYNNCQSLSNAKLCFDRISRPNIVAWTSMLSVYIDHSRFEEAVEFFRIILVEGVKPCKVTLLTICSAVSRVCEGTFVYECIMESGLSSDTRLTTALIAMFSRCGDMRSAECLFQRVYCTSLPLWNAMLGAYAKHEDGNGKAFVLFQLMQLEGLPPDRVTFLPLLSSCSDFSTGKYLHEWIVHLRMDPCIKLGAALVGMHSRCGSLEDALDVFYSFPHPDDILWNVAIQACGENNREDRAVELFRSMHLQGVKPSKATFILMLSLCRNSTYGEVLHSYLVTAGFDEDESVKNALVGMYGKCRRTGNALEVFDSFDTWNVVACTAMISGFAESFYFREALLLFKAMLMEGVKPNRVTLICIIGVLSEFGSLGDARLVRECVGSLLTFQEFSKEIAPGLVTMYGRLKQHGLALQVFGEACERGDAVLWNSMIGSCHEPFLYFRRMLIQGVSPDKVTFVILLPECRTIQEIIMLSSSISSLGFDEDNIINTGLVRAFGRCGCIEKAQEIFNRMEYHDSFSWMVLLAAYSENGNGGRSIQLLKQMQLEGVKLESVAIVKALSLCEEASQGTLIHENAVAAGFSLNHGVQTALVSFYGRIGRLEAAWEIFEHIKQRDVCSWTAMISAYSQAGQHEKAVNMFRNMQQEGIEADNVSVITVMNSWKTIELRSLLEEHTDDKLVQTALMSFLGQQKVEDACSVFEKMVTKDTVAWNVILDSYSHHGKISKVIETFRMMHLEGVGVDGATFASITAACSHSGLLTEGCNLLGESNNQKYLVENYAGIVDLVGRAGELEEAWKFVVENECTESMTWKTLLSCSKAYKDGTRGIDAAAQLFNRESASGEAYVMLSALLC